MYGIAESIAMVVLIPIVAYLVNDLKNDKGGVTAKYGRYNRYRD